MRCFLVLGLHHSIWGRDCLSHKDKTDYFQKCLKTKIKWQRKWLQRPEELVAGMMSLVLAVLVVHCRTEIPDQPGWGFLTGRLIASEGNVFTWWIHRDTICNVLCQHHCIIRETYLEMGIYYWKYLLERVLSLPSLWWKVVWSGRSLSQGVEIPDISKQVPFLLCIYVRGPIFLILHLWAGYRGKQQNHSFPHR